MIPAKSPVRRVLRRVPFALMSAMLLNACGESATAPGEPTAPTTTAVAPIQGTVALVATGVSETRVRAGEYAYLGCLSGYTPRVCIPATLEIQDDGRWFFRTYVLFTSPDHPTLNFFVFDLWHWTSRNSKCEGGGDPSFLGGSCPSEPRFAPSMTFDTWVDITGPSVPFPFERQRVTWYYKPSSPGF